MQVTLILGSPWDNLNLVDQNMGTQSMISLNMENLNMTLLIMEFLKVKVVPSDNQWEKVLFFSNQNKRERISECHQSNKIQASSRDWNKWLWLCHLIYSKWTLYRTLRSLHWVTHLRLISKNLNLMNNSSVM